MSSYRFSSHTSNHTRRGRSCERRGTKRLLCSDLVQISWLESPERRRSEVAILENLSALGVGLFCGVKVPEGEPIEVATGDRLLKGIVKQCQFRENGYLVGVELDPESESSQETSADFRPEHVLDVSLLQFD